MITTNSNGVAMKLPLDLTKIDALVFQGGGVKGIAYVGSLQHLRVRNFNLDHITNFAGTSAGSQVAALLACGYNEHELYDILYRLNMKDFKDGSFGFLRNTWRLFTKFGYYKGKFIEKFIDDLIEKKLGKRKITFKDLYEERGVTLRITGTCLTTGTLDYFDKDLTPDMPICKAVHISSCIPVFYSAVKYDGKYYVDGGVLRNLPIMAFPEKNVLFFELKGKSSSADDLTKQNSEVVVKHDIKNLFYFVIALLKICTKYCNKLAVEKGLTVLPNVNVVTIDTGDVKGTDFNLSEDSKRYLVKQGWNAIKQYVDYGEITEI